MSESAADARFWRRVSALEAHRQPGAERASYIDAMNSLAVSTFGFNGNTYALPLATTYGTSKQEEPDGSFPSFAELFVKRDAVVFGVMQARALLLSETRFKFRSLRDKKVFGTPALQPLDAPQANVDTGEWLTRIDQYASIGGNAYVVRKSRELLRPDWVSIVLASAVDPEHPAFAYDATPVGYIYSPPQGASRTFALDEVVHFSPIPDPVARFRGMSWLQPLVREILSDQAATVHKQRFFENAATPNLAIKFPESIKTREQFEQIRDAMEASSAGSSNAWKTLYLAAGADVTVVGADMQALDLKTIQGGYETRICVAARVPAVVAGVSEGMQGSSLNAGNFSQARRLFVDGWYRPYVRSLCATLAALVKVPSDAELWFDDTDIGFLREDKKDAAQIAQTQAVTIRQLLDAGFDPDAVVSFVQSLDPGQLIGKHSGLFSVQLQAPGSDSEGSSGTEDDSEDSQPAQPAA